MVDNVSKFFGKIYTFVKISVQQLAFYTVESFKRTQYPKLFKDFEQLFLDKLNSFMLRLSASSFSFFGDIEQQLFLWGVVASVPFFFVILKLHFSIFSDVGPRYLILQAVVSILVITCVVDKYVWRAAYACSVFYFFHILALMASLETRMVFKGVDTFSFSNNFTILNFDFVFDRVASVFLLLTAFLIFASVALSWQIIIERKKFYFFLLFVLQFFITLTFLSRDIFIFYISFEMVLIPMIFLIGVWGSRSRKILATYKFVLYTLLGSFCMLFAIVYIYIVTGTTNLVLVSRFEFSFIEQCILWFLFFVGFAVKVPIFPFHTWLPEAHVEASTVGSVILAGILLKLGGYGILRFNLNLFPLGFTFFRPLVCVLCVLSVLYASFVALAQTDIKKIIAYASIAHMNFAIVGLFVDNQVAISGSVFSMISHGIIASALFICVGELYGRYGTRHIGYYGGLAGILPKYSFMLFAFVMGNIALPTTSAFVGELLLITGIAQSNINLAFLLAPQMLLTTAYSIWFLNRLLFGHRFTVEQTKSIGLLADVWKERFISRSQTGESKPYDLELQKILKEISDKDSIKYIVDLDSREFTLLSVFLFFQIYLGVCPSRLLSYLQTNDFPLYFS